MSDHYTFEILARCFQAEGVDVCFALLGDANMNWAAALAERGCRFVYVRDEHNAVAAAMAWSRSTGEVGIATVTCGPGVTQILTALPAAVRANIPLVVFAGEAPLGKPWYNQQIEQRPFVEACGARYQPLHYPASMPRQVRDAFVTARRHRQPVVLGVPFDLQEQAWTGEPPLLTSSRTLVGLQGAMTPDPAQVETAATVITSAQKIIVIGGLGVVDDQAARLCVQLADQCEALLATTLPARGLFREHPFCIGIAGGFATDTARRCLQQADLIIAVGCRLAQHTSDNGKLFDAANVLHIDLHPQVISQGRVASQYQLQGDAGAALQALLPRLSSADCGAAGWRGEALAREIQRAPADAEVFDIEAGLHDPRDVVAALNSVLPDDWHMVNSSGHCSWFTAQMNNRPVDRFLTIREFGAIGNGIAFAIGVAMANPDRTIVLFDGDGSLLMHIQELETIRRHRLNIIICVLNDGAYGSEIHKLRAEGLSDQGAVFGRPEFADIAQGFGIAGKRVDNLVELANMVEQYVGQPAAQVWDFHVSDQVVSPVIRRSHLQ